MIGSSARPLYHASPFEAKVTEHNACPCKALGIQGTTAIGSG
jgi:hypothetical protein